MTSFSKSSKTFFINKVNLEEWLDKTINIKVKQTIDGQINKIIRQRSIKTFGKGDAAYYDQKLKDMYESGYLELYSVKKLIETLES